MSEDFWRGELAASPAALGGPLRLGGTVYTVVGILPSGFTGVDLEPVDVWLPLAAVGESLGGPDWPVRRGSSFLSLVARLPPGLPHTRVEAEGTQAFRRLTREEGEADPHARLLLGPVQRARGPNRPAAARIALSLTALSGFLLLIACGNVAHLLLVRSLARQREIGLRAALGASRGRLAHLVLAEGVLSAVLGSFLALAFLRAAPAWMPSALAPAAAGLAGVRTWALLGGLALLAGLAGGGLPALWVLHREQAAGLRGAVDDGARGQALVRRGLLLSQVALTFTLLVASGVFLQNLRDLIQSRTGFDADRTWVVALEGAGEESTSRTLERLRRLPGVEQAALATSIPFETSLALQLEVDGRPVLPEHPAGGPYVSGVSPTFFSAVGARLRRGHAFAPQGTATEAVVNETAARFFWPGEEALGRCVRLGGPRAPCATVIGVVEDLHRMSLREEPSLQVYVPLSAVPADLPRALFLRAGGVSFRPGSIRREVEAASGLPFVEVRRLRDLAAPEIQPWREGAAVLSLLGSLALVLSGVGLYGATAHDMVRRAREWALRIALGAQGREVWAPVLAQTAGVVAAGLAAGALLVLLIRPRLEPLLAGLSLLAPGVWACAAAVLATSAAAAVLPALWRLRAVDPAAVLRDE